MRRLSFYAGYKIFPVDCYSAMKINHFIKFMYTSYLSYILLNCDKNSQRWYIHLRSRGTYITRLTDVPESKTAFLFLCCNLVLVSLTHVCQMTGWPTRVYARPPHSWLLHCWAHIALPPLLSSSGSPLVYRSFLSFSGSPLVYRSFLSFSASPLVYRSFLSFSASPLVYRSFCRLAALH
jgi:hypothetical protein